MYSFVNYTAKFKSIAIIIGIGDNWSIHSDGKFYCHNCHKPSVIWFCDCGEWPSREIKEKALKLGYKHASKYPPNYPDANGKQKQIA